MKILKIKIENLGDIKSFEKEITKDIVVIEQRSYKDVLFGLSRVASNRLFYDILETNGINENTCVTGAFTFKGELWRVESSYNVDYTEETRGKFIIRNGQRLAEKYYLNGEHRELTTTEYSGLHIPVDENGRFWFSRGRKIDGEKAGRVPHWLADVDFEKYFQRRKDDEFFKVWVETFKPIAIDEGKDLYLSFDENYRFIPVKIENGVETACAHLSESDITIFDYLCFLEVNRFEFEREEYNGYNCAKKPLFIFNFAEYLDESVDIVGLLKQATDLGSQVFLFASGCEIERLKETNNVQILEM